MDILSCPVKCLRKSRRLTGSPILGAWIGRRLTGLLRSPNWILIAELPTNVENDVKHERFSVLNTVKQQNTATACEQHTPLTKLHPPHHTSSLSPPSSSVPCSPSPSSSLCAFLTCLFKLLFTPKSLPHPAYGHPNGRSPVCMRMCTTQLECLSKLLLQWVHSRSFRPSFGFWLEAEPGVDAGALWALASNSCVVSVSL